MLIYFFIFSFCITDCFKSLWCYPRYSVCPPPLAPQTKVCVCVVVLFFFFLDYDGRDEGGFDRAGTKNGDSFCFYFM